ncbi:hypothetical protein MMC22_002256 [Lobaria immixta]|nr:hypothetical protein [Lobaria immixta]
MDPTNTRKLNEHVFALSELSRIHENALTRPPKMLPEEMKHLRILDGIALLLVVEEKGDVAAATFRQTTDTIDVYYAKNSPCRPDIDPYIQDILDFITESRDLALEALAAGILSRAVEKCVRKVRYRLTKIVNGLKDVLKDSLCNDDKIVQSMFPKAELSAENRSLLIGYVRDLQKLSLKDIEQFRAQILQLNTAVVNSHFIGKWEGFAVGQDFERVRRRIQKLGDYLGGAMCIAKVCQEYRKEKIRVIEVPPPPPKPEKVWRSAFKCMNAYCEKGNETDSKKFSSSFPKLDSMLQDERTLTTSVHCELTLLLHSITSNVYCVKIGISKHCCWLCEKYIEAFHALYKKEKKFLVAGFQGKIHAGWSLPPGTPPPIQISMEKLLEHELDEIRAEVKAQRRSDSWPAEVSQEVLYEKEDYIEVIKALENLGV